MCPRLGIPTGFRAVDRDADTDSADELLTLTWYFIFMVKYGQFPEMVRGPQAYINNFHRS